MGTGQGRRARAQGKGTQGKGAEDLRGRVPAHPVTGGRHFCRCAAPARMPPPAAPPLWSDRLGRGAALRFGSSGRCSVLAADPTSVGNLLIWGWDPPSLSAALPPGWGVRTVPAKEDPSLSAAARPPLRFGGMGQGAAAQPTAQPARQKVALPGRLTAVWRLVTSCRSAQIQRPAALGPAATTAPAAFSGNRSAQPGRVLLQTAAKG